MTTLEHIQSHVHAVVDSGRTLARVKYIKNPAVGRPCYSLWIADGDRVKHYSSPDAAFRALRRVQARQGGYFETRPLVG